MSNYRLLIEYDGGRYKGWQRQPGKADTIQGRIEKILSKMLEKDIEIDGAGRTDAGVHARGQVANFRCDVKIEPCILQEKLNEYLPEDIRILKADLAGERFHSRLNAIGKVYEYRLKKKDCFDVFSRKYSWQMTEELNVDRMQKASKQLLGQHDFKGFCTRASKKKSTIRRVDDITIREEEKDIYIRFEGNGFLYNMVRILVGTLVEIGAGKKAPEVLAEVLETGQRTLAGETAPAQGLTLVAVKYD